MITIIFGESERVITVNESELEIARKNFPCLLDQANSYGCDVNGSRYAMGPMPIILANNFAEALANAREVHRG
jgi:hypothetical protein